MCVFFVIKLLGNLLNGRRENYANFFGGGNCMSKQLLNKRSE